MRHLQKIPEVSKNQATDHFQKKKNCKHAIITCTHNNTHQSNEFHKYIML